MKTEDLVANLSLDASPGKRWSPVMLLALAVGAGLAIALLFSFLLLPTRNDLMTALMSDHVVMLKIVFAVSVIVITVPIVRELTLPGRSIGAFVFVTLLPFLIITILAAFELSALSLTEWHHVIVGSSWIACLWKVPLLALPSFILLSLSVRQLAPTNLRLTGAFIGLLAGGIGAAGYALHCHDDSVSFVAIAYSLAITEMTLFGALLGPRILKWN